MRTLIATTMIISVSWATHVFPGDSQEAAVRGARRCCGIFARLAYRIWPRMLFTRSQLEAIDDYVNSPTSTNFNRWLRGLPEWPDLPYEPDLYRWEAQQIDRVMARLPDVPAGRYYRGIRFSEARPEMKKLDVGSKTTELGYTSVSRSFSVALRNFASRGNRKGIVYVIDVPPNLIRGIDVDKTGVRSFESEFILPRGMKYEITGEGKVGEIYVQTIRIIGFEQRELPK